MTDIIIELSDSIKTKDPSKQCKGLIYRGKRNAFINGRDEYVYSERMMLLKRKSCKGCERCGFLHEELQQSLDMDCLPLMPSYLEDGCLYQLSVTNMSKDWETGYVDDYDLEFVKYVEKDDE